MKESLKHVNASYLVRKIYEVQKCQNSSITLNKVFDIAKLALVSFIPLRRDVAFQKKMQISLAVCSQHIVKELHETSSLVSKKLVHFDQYCQSKISCEKEKKVMQENPRLSEILLLQERGAAELEPNIEKHVMDQTAKGLKPSEILKNLVNQSSSIRSDCGRAVELVFWMTVWRLLGDEKFDHILSLPGMKFHIGYGGALHREGGSSLHFFTSPIAFFTQSIKNKRIGTRCTLDGLPYYRLKHLFGISNTTHAIALGTTNKTHQTLFWSLDFPSSLSTYEEITAKHIEDYNQPQSSLVLEALSTTGINPFDLPSVVASVDAANAANAAHSVPMLAGIETTFSSAIIAHVIQTFHDQYGIHYNGVPWQEYFRKENIETRCFSKQKGLKEIANIQHASRRNAPPSEDQICPGFISMLQKLKLEDLTLEKLIAAKTTFLLWQMLRPHFFDYETGRLHLFRLDSEVKSK